MPFEVTEWLVRLGLAKYAELFADNEIGFDVLPELSETDLQELGIPLGDRKRLIKAIGAIEKSEKDAAKPSRKADGPSEGERRRITVMFCDLTESTSLSNRLDPEDLRDLLRVYRESCAEVVARYDGHIAKYIGDGLLIYFGYPRAHEDDAQRAVHAGLEIVTAVRQLGERIGVKPNVDLDVHIGIHSGLVVAGEMGAGDTREEMAIVGETPNIAARLESLAEPGCVLISESTRALVEGLFYCQGLGPQELKGIPAPLDVYRVQNETGARSRFEVAASRGLMPLIGRDQEIALLLERWERARIGEGQIVLLSGEAGIGKSRIVQTLRENVDTDNHAQLHYQCSAYHKNSALYPFVDELERAAGFDRDDLPTDKLRKLKSLNSAAADRNEDLTATLAALLSIPIGGSATEGDESPETLKENAFTALLERHDSVSLEKPTFVAFEDAHWIDPTSKELLDLIVDKARSQRILIVITYRPEFDAPWTEHPHATSLVLNRLGRQQSEAIIAALSREMPLPEDVSGQILEKTDGVPLFLEELTRTVLEAENPTGESDIPATLHASLMARLDKLGQAKEVAQAGAVIGREFSLSLLAESLAVSQEALSGPLTRLLESGLVFPRNTPANPTYIFKHALVQDTAYDSLLHSTRRRLHGRVAEALKRDAEMTNVRPETLAYHYTEASRPTEAAAMWMQAGREAARRSADREAVAHYRNGLKIVTERTDAAERDTEELKFQLALSARLMATEGWGSPETARTYARARELCKTMGTQEDLLPILYGEYLISVANAEYHTALDTASELLQLAETQGDEVAILQGHRVLGWCSLYLGEFEAAGEHADRLLALYSPERHGSAAFKYGHDVHVAGLSVRVITHWVAGFGDKAAASSRDSLAHARGLSHTSSLAYALMFSCALPAVMRGDHSAARDFANELLSLAREQRNAFWHAYALVILGWTESKSGNASDGMTRLEEGLENLASSVRNPWRPLFLALLAETRLEAGALLGAVSALGEAERLVVQTGERNWEVEITRLQGVAALAQENEDRAEAYFRRAVELADSQGANALGLRAATDLARLLRSRGSGESAQTLLAPRYHSFTEGFDDPDLKNAQLLLNRLK